jgi:hypothetical protein
MKFHCNVNAFATFKLLIHMQRIGTFHSVFPICSDMFRYVDVSSQAGDLREIFHHDLQTQTVRMPRVSLTS